MLLNCHLRDLHKESWSLLTHQLLKTVEILDTLHISIRDVKKMKTENVFAYYFSHPLCFCDESQDYHNVNGNKN